MNPIREQIDLMTRRHFFGRTGLSLGTAALSTLLARNARSDDSPAAASDRDWWFARACLISRPRPGGPSTST